MYIVELQISDEEFSQLKAKFPDIEISDLPYIYIKAKALEKYSFTAYFEKPEDIENRRVEGGEEIAKPVISQAEIAAEYERTKKVLGRRWADKFFDKMNKCIDEGLIELSDN